MRVFWSEAEKGQVQHFIIHFYNNYSPYSDFIAVGLKPLTKSHIARTNSFKTIGSFKIISSEIIPVTSNRFTVINNMAAITPHTDIHRGMSFD